MIRRVLVVGALAVALCAAVPVVARQATPGTPAAGSSPAPGPVSCDDAINATPVAATPAGTPAPGSTGPVYTTGPVTIHLTDEGFRPDRVLSAVGHDLTLTLTNTGTRLHAFCSETLGIDVALAPGESTTIALNDLPLGEYPFVSNLPGDEGMRGRMTIFI